MMLSETIPSTVLSGVVFNTFRASDIKRLSVKEITNLQTFDALGHPTTGGLHDSSMGPAEMEDQCTTCGQNGLHCPGHLAHINFPLPVYNPLFFRTLYTVLRATCFSCHRFLARSERIMIAINQHKLLQFGLLERSELLQAECSRFIHENDPRRTSAAIASEDKKEEKIPLIESDQAVLSELVKLIDKFMKESLKGIDKKSAIRDSLLKNLVDIREQLRREIAIMAFLNVPKACVHCGELRRPLRSEYHCKIFFSSKALSSERKKMKKHANLMKSKNAPQDGDDELADDYEDEDIGDERRAIRADREKLLTSLKDQIYLTPLQAREHMRALWSFSECRQILQQLFGSLGEKSKTEIYPTDVFFLDLIPVAPTRFRPVQMMKGQKYENMQTANLSKALRSAQAVTDVLAYIQQEKEMKKNEEQNEKEITTTGDESGTEAVPPAMPVQISVIPGDSGIEKLHNAWIRLQLSVNGIVDSALDKLSQKSCPGIKQILEKKEGLFRKHMMGKRVDYAARSVISPDPYIDMDEVGIPEVFATKLTYPEPVTPWNVAELSQAVINGPDVHPGATFVEQEDGFKIKLSKDDLKHRQALANQLLKPMETKKCLLGRKKVYRHLRNGDILLLNRQPTLHRPSIQAHKAKVLRGEKTLRLHYANCKAYNADFDGDEMNAHFPQNELARAEAYNIVNTAHSYLVPKDGTPLAGLIQDHVVSGVLLSIRGRFFMKSDYQHLVYSGLMNHHNPMALLRPTILKPHVLWSGKQVISTVLLNLIPKGKPPLNMVGKAKIGRKSWIRNTQSSEWKPGGKALQPDELSESCVIFRDGELLCGVLDKAHYGPTPYGLVHCCYEVYGPEMAGKLLTSLAKVFTAFLQMRGFSLGVEDILVTEKADSIRQGIIEASTRCGPSVAAKAFGLTNQKKMSQIEKKFKTAQYGKDDAQLKELDLCMKSRTDDYQNEIAKACMPHGLHKPFPSNNLQLMVQSGAKGSSVNTMQISCLLGQIELEGRRPPLMCTGRSLPSFLPYDTSPRAGGFVSGRFLTGIRPQEYFFHCMAGREGLVDTAVKTSRSGYLQRCLIKHLEGLVIGYDLTVRDSDGSIVQFQYGEDSLDILSTPFLNTKQIPFLVENHGCLLSDEHLKELSKVIDTDSVEEPKRKTLKRLRKSSAIDRQHSRTSRSAFLNFCQDLNLPVENKSTLGRSASSTDAITQWRQLTRKQRKKYVKMTVAPSDPVNSIYRPDRHLGSMSENHQKMVEEFLDDEKQTVVIDDELPDIRFNGTRGEGHGHSQSQGQGHMLSKSRYNTLMNVRHLKALVEPGQAVGLLAAQSIGEPSTQMTLNTFHFAGRGEMNVTLGIPRLREILMIASANIKTPAMEIPVLSDATQKATKNLQLVLTRVTLDQVLTDVSVVETTVVDECRKARRYLIRFEYLPEDCYKDKFFLTPDKVAKFVETKFFFSLNAKVRKLLLSMNVKKSLSSAKLRNRISADDGNENEAGDGQNEAADAQNEADDDDDVEDDDQNDGDATADKKRRQRSDDVDYEGEEEERDELLENPSQSSDGSSSDSDSDNESSDEDYEDKVKNKSHLNAQIRKRASAIRKERKSVNQIRMRINAVLQSISFAVDFKYDTDQELWSEVTIELPLSTSSTFDMTSVIELVARSAVIWETNHINRCYLSQNKMVDDPEAKTLKTEGVNIQEMLKYDKVLDLNNLYSNDIHAIASTYGIEAAGKAIVKELRNVFAAYGIDVNYRHLSLISDYMTFEGKYRPFNRVAMESSASPLQKMTFETAMHFIKSATISGAQDKLESPSSRLVVGQPVYSGTGCFQLIQPLTKPGA